MQIIQPKLYRLGFLDPKFKFLTVPILLIFLKLGRPINSYKLLKSLSGKPDKHSDRFSRLIGIFSF